MKTWQATQAHYETWVHEDGIPTAFEEVLEDGTTRRVQLVNFGTDDDVEVVARNLGRAALFGYAHCIGRTVANAFFEEEAVASWQGELGMSVKLAAQADPEFDLHVRAAHGENTAPEQAFFRSLRTRLRVLESLKTSEDELTVHLVFHVTTGTATTH